MSRRLNEVPGYRWTEDDVRFERSDGWYEGFNWGLFVGFLAGTAGIILSVFL